MNKRKIVAITLALTVFCATAAAAADFSDVPSNAWYAEDVDFVTSKGLFTGTSSGLFSPLANMTRAMFATVLGRFAEVDTEAIPASGRITSPLVIMRSQPNTDSDILTTLTLGTKVDVLSLDDNWYKIRHSNMSGYVRSDLMSAADTKFTDIGYGTYYGGYVRWAQSEGIITGVSETEFAPNGNILREQICLLLYNYSVSAKIPLPDDENMLIFSDDSLISPYAKTAVYAMKRAGVISGYTNGTFNPKGTTTRAEVAAIINRFTSATGEEPNVPDVPDVPDNPDEHFANYPLFGNVISESAAVTDSYFDDACFIGHSMVVGMSNYFSLPKADYIALTGISASGLLKYSQFPLKATYVDENGETVHQTGMIGDAISEKDYGKVYIMLGVNELGPDPFHANSFYTSISSLIDVVREKQPGAKIYLISILPVSRSLSESSDSFNLANILNFNSKLMQASSEKNVYYIDAFGPFTDAGGYLPDSSGMYDGIHILSSEYERLKTVLKTHTANNP